MNIKLFQFIFCYELLSNDKICMLIIIPLISKTRKDL
jgi:hypothetical protein